MDFAKICLGCMREKKGDGRFCELCGFSDLNYLIEPHQLPLRTILNGKYMLGKVLGEGGFGITYIAVDLNLNMPVAIKEYYPNGFVARNTTMTGDTAITKFQGEKLEFFERGLERFLEEARSLAQFYQMSGIAAVKDFFKENDTAYIVMEYVDGITLKEYLKKQGGRIDYKVVLALMQPIIHSLEQVHAEGIIHRDISPDNIMFNSKGDLKLLDFGAARNYETNQNKSLSIMLKPGYAPEEQYRSKGTQGPYTDVYALCATMYKMITGKTPPESLERRVGDSIVWPRQLGINIPENIELVLKKGMEIISSNRIQNMKELASYLYQGATISMNPNIGYVQPPLMNNQGVTPPPAQNTIYKGNMQEQMMYQSSDSKGNYWKEHAISLAIIVLLGLISVGVTWYIKHKELKNVTYGWQSKNYIEYSIKNAFIEDKGEI